MKVYLVIQFVDCDHDEVEAVFRNEASAQALCDEENRNSHWNTVPYYQAWTPPGEEPPEDWRVEEWEVQDGTGVLPHLPEPLPDE